MCMRAGLCVSGGWSRLIGRGRTGPRVTRRSSGCPRKCVRHNEANALVPFMIPNKRDGGGLDTPVVLLIFNRPDFTEVVFRAIAQARPKRLFVFADGPRTPEEVAL